MKLRDFLADRKITMEAAGLLAGKDTSTISRIAAGKLRPRPATVVKLATALGTSARRMQAMCDESWQAAHMDDETDTEEADLDLEHELAAAGEAV
jgi:transcriptional regulator with XRE-family HTH domain